MTGLGVSLYSHCVIALQSRPIIVAGNRGLQLRPAVAPHSGLCLSPSLHYRIHSLQHAAHRLDVALLGKITLSRFLELPLRALDRLVTETEACADYRALSRWVAIDRTDRAPAGANLSTPASPTSSSSTLLGAVHITNRHSDGLAFAYRRDSYARLYRFDEAALCAAMARPGFSSGMTAVIHKLRLINSRNRLTHAMLQSVLELQAGYLQSGQTPLLSPLTQASLAERLRSNPQLSVIADPSRISRLARGMSIMLPQQNEVALSALFAKPRHIARHLVDHVIKKESAWILQGLLPAPLTDIAIAEMLARDHGVFASRRTIVNIRRDLAIPDCRNRSMRMFYLAATEGFSALVPLTSQMLRASVPAHAGVYEIRAAFLPRAAEESVVRNSAGLIVPPRPHSVLYIGSATNLRKRLGDHLRGHSDNQLLYQHIAGGIARVRFRLIDDGWRLAERNLYRVFCETFGAPPPCNRMSP